MTAATDLDWCVSALILPIHLSDINLMSRSNYSWRGKPQRSSKSGHYLTHLIRSVEYACSISLILSLMKKEKRS